MCIWKSRENIQKQQIKIDSLYSPIHDEFIQKRAKKNYGKIELQQEQQQRI